MKEQEIVVMKFGGISVENAEGFNRAAKIVKDYSRSNQVVAVVSAIYGVTNQLFELVDSIQSGKQKEAEDRINHLYELHVETGASLGLLQQRPLSESLHKFRMSLLSFALLPQLQPSQKDFIASYGERLSYLLLSGVINNHGMLSQALDAADIIATDNEYGNAKVNINASRIMVYHYLRPLLNRNRVPVIGGFYGLSQEGRVAILGRGGSDYSAAILANLLDAKKLVLWKEVDGIYNADPKKDPSAEFLSEVSYDQAEDLARNRGAKILHPEAIDPLRAKSISIEVKNFNDPDAVGSIVTGNSTDRLDLHSTKSEENQTGQSFWLNEIVKPELIEIERLFFALGDTSIEFILRNRFVSARADIRCDEITRRRLYKLLMIFTSVAYPNMLPREQQIIESGIYSKEVTEADARTIEVIQWIWRTFKLQVPQSSQLSFPLMPEGG